MAGLISIGKGGITLGKKAPQAAAQNQPGMDFLSQTNPSSQSALPPTDMKEDVNNASRRIKMLEERYTNMRSKFQVLEQNMLHKNKTFFTEIKSINLEMVETKKEINELKDKIMILIKELDSFARKDSVEILRKYIDLWNPVNFATKNEVEDIVREVIDKIRKGK